MGGGGGEMAGLLDCNHSSVPILIFDIVYIERTTDDNSIVDFIKFISTILQ